MKKRNLKITSLITATLTIMMTLNVTTAKAMGESNISDNGTKEYNTSNELSTLNNGEEPKIYSNEENESKFIDGAYTNIKVENEVDALKSINSIKNLMNIDYPEDQLTIAKVNRNDYITSYKLQQVYNGVPLYGRELVVATDKEGNTTSVGGNFLKGVNVDTNATLSKDDAVAKAKEAYGENAEVVDANLVIYSLDNIEPTLCWKVQVDGTKDENQFAVAAFINAKTGEKVKDVSLLTKEFGTGVDVTGNTRTFNVNKTNKLFVGTNYELNDTVRNIKIYNASNGLLPGTMVKDRNNIWNDPVSVSAMYNLQTIYDYYYNKLGRTSYDNDGAKIVASVHFKLPFINEGFDNAMWTPLLKQFVFGDGEKLFKPLVGGLDVTAHEFTHAVVTETANLEYKGESGALNESYADIFGNIIEGDDDPEWLLGEDVVKEGVGLKALRNMSDPESTNQPSTVNGKYYVDTNSKEDNGGVHTNSGILNRAAYLMWKNGITDKERLVKLFYNSLFVMTSTSNFKDCRVAVLSSAKNLRMTSDEIKIIEDAFDAVGITA